MVWADKTVFAKKCPQYIENMWIIYSNVNSELSE